MAVKMRRERKNVWAYPETHLVDDALNEYSALMVHPRYIYVPMLTDWVLCSTDGRPMTVDFCGKYVGSELWRRNCGRYPLGDDVRVYLLLMDDETIQKLKSIKIECDEWPHFRRGGELLYVDGQDDVIEIGDWMWSPNKKDFDEVYDVRGGTRRRAKMHPSNLRLGDTILVRTYLVRRLYSDGSAEGCRLRLVGVDLVESGRLQSKEVGHTLGGTSKELSARNSARPSRKPIDEDNQ